MLTFTEENSNSLKLINKAAPSYKECNYGPELSNNMINNLLFNTLQITFKG